MPQMLNTSWQDLNGQTLNSRSQVLTAKKPSRKAERNLKGWTGLEEEAVNKDWEV